MAITVDVKAAHKRMKVAHEDGGLAFFWFWGLCWRYIVCHLGASWSAWWWGRVSGALMRLLHFFLGEGHVAFNYVDDTVVFVRSGVVWRMAALIGIFMEMLGVPLGWHKLRVSEELQYVGLMVNLGELTLGLAVDKVRKLLAFLETIRKGNRLDRRGLEKGVGAMQ